MRLLKQCRGIALSAVLAYFLLSDDHVRNSCFATQTPPNSNSAPFRHAQFQQSEKQQQQQSPPPPPPLPSDAAAAATRSWPPQQQQPRPQQQQQSVTGAEHVSASAQSAAAPQQRPQQQRQSQQQQQQQQQQSLAQRPHNNVPEIFDRSTGSPYHLPPPPLPRAAPATTAATATATAAAGVGGLIDPFFVPPQLAPSVTAGSTGAGVATAVNGNTLYGEDLSQVDKDLIFEGLKQLYKKKVLPLELSSKYAHFGSPPLGPSDFDAKPMVLIIGQYSVGKTSFIRSLVKQDFPGQRIGPEPTTDRFTAIMHTADGQQQGRLIPGHALVMQNSKPFRGLASYGNNFLSKFEGAEVAAPILRNITIVDTPGVLAGEKQRLGRDYDFSEVIKWFAERADMIIIMFDAHKLDISDELKLVLDTLKPHQEKVRVLLNKADTIDTQALLRVYGALMWSLGKVVQTPEVCKVYLGSFWEAPLRNEDNRAILEKEKSDLLQEMAQLPQNAVVRRINELVKRARSVKVHAFIIHYLKKQMPYMLGKSDKQRRLIGRLDQEFKACARRYNLPLGDFPNVAQYQRMLSEIKDISDFKKLDKNLVAEMDRVLTHDIPLLLQKATTSSSSSSSFASGGGGKGSFGLNANTAAKYNPMKYFGAPGSSSSSSGRDASSTAAGSSSSTGYNDGYAGYPDYGGYPDYPPK